ncbi:MAG: type II toxin-antitoxin system prevent-host-death family antitoxin [Thermotogae bacterium]|nr:type II toxin-antitoxin system prevent-host-death family antitoxin [Thermotogota bacterium]HOO76090.1 type II toxin-antitoxin system prevent-host-death family antitoxin [Tepiditoga sp.]
MNLKNLQFYSLAEAKSKFSKVVEESKDKYIVITKNGKPETVVFEYSKFVKFMNFVDQIMELSLLEINDYNEYKELKEFFDKFEED